MIMLPAVLLTLVLVANGATSALAGVLIVGNQTPTGGRTEFRVQDGGARISSAAGQVVYYDHAKRTSYFVDAKQGTYLEMNEGRARQMGDQSAQIAEAQRVMAEKLKDLPADQRAMAEGLAKQHGGPPPGTQPSAAKPLVFARSGSGQVGTWSCDRYKGSAGALTVEVCTADPAALGITASDFAVLEGFRSLSQSIASEAARGGGLARGPDQGYAGFPLERKESQGGQTSHFVIREIRKEEFPASDVTLPADLRPLPVSAP